MKSWAAWSVLLVVWGWACSAGAGVVVVDFERHWLFPQELGGLKYEVSEKYETADFGYRVVYRGGESFEAEVTIFDMGYESIPNGCKGEGIDAVLQGVDDALKLRLKHGEIENLKKLRTSVVSKEGILRFASVVFAYNDAETEGMKTLQATYATGIKNQFLTLQLTFERAKKEQARKMANEMMVQLTQMVTADPTDEELVLASCSAFLNDPYSFGGLSSAKYLMAKANTMGNLSVYTHLFVWPTGYYSKPKNADLLIAAYFAGMLQVVVPQHLDEGGEFEGFVAMLDAYKVLRSKDQIQEIPKLDEWVKNSDKRTLFDQLLILE